MTNNIPQDPIETWTVRICQADAAMVEHAYWVAKAHEDGLIDTPDEMTQAMQEGKV